MDGFYCKSLFIIDDLGISPFQENSRWVASRFPECKQKHGHTYLSPPLARTHLYIYIYKDIDLDRGKTGYSVTAFTVKRFCSLFKQV